ncbi:MAG: sensor histidine kinase [Candidatus Limnocylindria bacterium]
MDRLGLSLRLFAVLLLATFPPLLVLAAVGTLGDGQIGNLGRATSLMVMFLSSLLWLMVVAVVASRLFGRDILALVQLAERGRTPAQDASTTETARLGAAHRRVAGLLDERDRQMRELASQTASAPITQDAMTVSRHVIQAARHVTGDATWTLAILESSDDRLSTGVHPGPDTETASGLEDLHRWASVAGDERAGSVRHVTGPWGAFVVAHVSAVQGFHAILLAPWEGRAEPSPAELSVISLLAQHGATALEHALLYARVRDQADELNRLAALQSDFLRGVTHDLQSPLTSIAALASGLRADLVDIPSTAAADLDVIGFQAERLRRMVTQLLTMSGLEARAIQPRSDVFRAEPLVRRVWTSMRAEDRELELSVTGPDRLVVGDSDRLEQALWALLDNAVKYSPDGDPVSVLLTCRAGGGEDRRSPGGQVEAIAITDHGIGMDAETQALAFEQFYRSEDARRLVPDGSGIGLYTAAGLIRLMGGQLAVTSAPGRGTTVTITLPAELVNEQATPSSAAVTA